MFGFHEHCLSSAERTQSALIGNVVKRPNVIGNCPENRPQMKRFRITNMEFDTRAKVLEIEILDSWEENVKLLWLQNKEIIISNIFTEYGQKPEVLVNFIDLGAKPFSVISSHNLYHEHARHAFIVGAYYASVTAVCALGERILNYLVISLRDTFKNVTTNEDINTHKSFSNWKLLNETLLEWGIFEEDIFDKFKALAQIRHRVIHYNKKLDTDLRETALQSLKLLAEIISIQFSGLANSKYFISEMASETYIKKQYENHPFVELVYLPNGTNVSPFHNVKNITNGVFEIEDLKEFEGREISDSEFIDLRNKHLKSL